MMSVSEYANDVGKSVKQIIELCQKLEINVKSEDDAKIEAFCDTFL